MILIMIMKVMMMRRKLSDTVAAAAADGDSDDDDDQPTCTAVCSSCDRGPVTCPCRSSCSSRAPPGTGWPGPTPGNLAR